MVRFFQNLSTEQHVYVSITGSHICERNVNCLEAKGLDFYIWNIFLYINLEKL